MEEYTRAKSTDELLRHLFNKLALVENDAIIAKDTLAAKMEIVNSSITAKMETMTSEIRSLFETLKPVEEEDGTNSMSSNDSYSDTNVISPTHSLNNQSDMNSNQTVNSSLTENHRSMELPRFNRENPRAWVLETIKYFNDNPMTDSDKIDLYASKYSNYRDVSTWSDFIDSNLSMFRESGQNHVIVDFHQLRQHGTVDDYINLWMDLKEITSVICPNLPEKYYIHCFIGGLKQEIRSNLWLIQPSTLEQAINIARLEEDISETLNNSLFDQETIEEEDIAEISMNTLSGFSSYQSIRLLGYVGKHEITILIDFCSSHSFIKDSTANHLKCSLKERTPPLPVITSSINGSTVYSFHECSEFSWLMKGYEFKTNHVHILNDLGCDLVLGLNWLKEIGPIEVDYKTMRLTVFQHGKPIVLTG